MNVVFFAIVLAAFVTAGWQQLFGTLAADAPAPMEASYNFV